MLAERGRDEDDVDVRGDDLLAHGSRSGVGRRAPYERRPARKDCLDHAVPVEPDPVADDREVRGCRRSPETWRDFRSHLVVRGQDVVVAAVLDGYAPGRESVAAVRREGFIPGFVPAEHRESGHSAIVVERAGRQPPPALLVRILRGVDIEDARRGELRQVFVASALERPRHDEPLVSCRHGALDTDDAYDDRSGIRSAARDLVSAELNPPPPIPP